MNPSKVYFTNLRTKIGVSQLDKLEQLIRAAGIGEIDFDHKMTAIKIHFGEPGNLTFLRPNYARRVADVVKSLGGVPFLTDCNTLYPGRRKNALEHIESAYENGFTPYATGCQVIIGDGLKGSDDIEVPVRNGQYVKNAKIGRAIMDADVFISLSHFKGHEQTGFGGTLKNIGMGCGSRRGKMEQHAAGKPEVSQSRCVGCRQCAKQCAQDAFTYADKKASIDHTKCVGCGRCIAACNFDAIYNPNDSAAEMLDRKMAEYAMAVVDGRPQFHISLVIDISPYCDCHGENDMPIVPNVGILASYDPVALDKACVDLVLKQPVIKGSLLDVNSRGIKQDDYFRCTQPVTHWQSTFEHSEKMGFGSQEYELITVR